MLKAASVSFIRMVRLPGRWIYRVSQFVRGLLAHVTPDEMLVVTETLPKAAVALFVEMPLDAQRHSLNVLYSLRKHAGPDGAVDPSLAAAGLLHDVGKIAANRAGQGIRLWQRGPLVLLEAVAPKTMDDYADGDAQSGWRYTLHVHREHPAIGAAMAAKAGCNELTCWLIAHHQEVPHTLDADETALAYLAALRRADQRN